MNKIVVLGLKDLNHLNRQYNWIFTSPWPHFPEQAVQAPVIHLNETEAADSFDSNGL